MPSARPDSGAARTPRAVDRRDPDYPSGLRDLRDAPPMVHIRGEISPRESAIAIVGSRAATPYGQKIARDLARDLAGLGFAIVSGLARGIDAAAHRGALETGGRTIAVLAGGLDHVAPRHHVKLAEEIASTGGLLTEWPSGPPAQPGMFVRRNRLIAAISAAVVVVEADERSGALSTAAAARRLGRLLFAVPGDIDRPSSRGCLALLRGGARVCGSAADVAGALPSLAATPRALVLGAVLAEPRGADEIALTAGVPIDQALAELLSLEWSGAIEACPGGNWRRAGSVA
ncbi:MAG TPA: DNA-processing protein DprA [Candidatus Udaeobacter sp.]|nr:DNA-processing protein DprA [Candidatus Udaeobacter sp.]